MRELDYSFIDFKHNIPTPPPESIKNAGLYTGESFSKKPWGNDYSVPNPKPNAEDFAARFYAKHHIPSQSRPGNNYINTELFKYYDNENYNFKCFV
jgi:hypothetical protein